MKRKFSALAAVLMGFTLTAHAMGPLTYKEIALEIRNHVPEQSVLNEAAQRKLLQPLTPQEEAELTKAGASAGFLKALCTPALLASPNAVALYQARLHSKPVPAEELSLPKAETPPPLFVTSHFTAALEAAKTAPAMVLHPDDAFSLSQLEQAKAKAQTERKPLGFILVWKQYFGKRTGPRLIGGQSALVHFYEAFHEPLVLVFVRHETELNAVPAAVKEGFNGPDEGGYAPSMAVVDATASEFIVQIPLGGAYADGARRDEVFAAGARRIDEWLAAHPTAVSSRTPVKQH